MNAREAAAAAKRIVRKLRGWGSEENLAGMARFGVDTSHALGVPLSKLRPLAKELGPDHKLALALWNTGVREARVIAFLCDDPRKVTRGQANQWAREAGSWDVCDGMIIHLLRKTPFAWELARRWARQRQQWVRRAGFVMIAVLAVHDKGAPDARFLEVLPLIEEHAADERNFVKKAVNWALRQIGKRSPELRPDAIRVSERLARSEAAAARWVGKDALRELRKRSGSR